MATKTKIQNTTEQDAAEAKTVAENKAAIDAEAKAKEEAEAAAKAGAEAKAKDEAEARAEAAAPAPERVSLDELAGKDRLPSWQIAALNRLMGWESGKKVTEKEYKDALERLKSRRIGG